MREIVTVLLVPADGDPHGLLADGVCGARPPMCWSTPVQVHASRWTEPDEDDGDDFISREMCQECGKAWPCPDAGQVAEPARWRPPYTRSYPAIPHDAPRALVLAYQGKPVAEGCDRAWRALHGMCLARAKTTGGATYCIHMRETYTTEWVEDVCAKWGREGARAVFLDADGHEVTRG